MKGKTKNNAGKYFKRSVFLLICLAMLFIPFILGFDFDGSSEEDHYEEESSPVITDEELYEVDSAPVTFDEPDFDVVVDQYAIPNPDCIYAQVELLEFDAEKTRLYDFLYFAYSSLQADDRDFIEEYLIVKDQWINAMPDFDEETQVILWQMIDDEDWTIDISIPLDFPFQLNHDEFILVYLYFTKENPQFSLNLIIPMTMECDMGLTPYISLPAYYAFADRR